MAMLSWTSKRLALHICTEYYGYLSSYIIILSPDFSYNCNVVSILPNVQTHALHVDQDYIEQTVSIVYSMTLYFYNILIYFQQIAAFDSLIKDIDCCTGIARCRHTIARLDYLHDEQVTCYKCCMCGIGICS